MGLRPKFLGSGSEPSPADGSATAEYGRLASFLAIGVGLTGLITYAYFLIASHVLSKPDYGQITVLWSAVFITISTLYRPVEQLLSRHISERLVKSEPIGQPMRVAATIQLGLAAFFAVLALVLRGPIQDNLLEGNETLYWVFFTSVLFYAASYFARGFLAGNRRRQDKGETTRAKSDDFAHNMYYQESDFAVVDAVGDIASKRGVPNAQVALAWLLSRRGVTSPIVGASKMNHLEDAIAATSITLSEEEIKAMSKPYTPHRVLGHT